MSQGSVAPFMLNQASAKRSLMGAISMLSLQLVRHLAQQLLYMPKMLLPPLLRSNARYSRSEVRTTMSVVGMSAVSIIHAASNTRSGEVVAMKRLQFGSSRKNGENEAALYDEILESLRDNRYATFIMQKRALLANETPQSRVSEVCLL